MIVLTLNEERNIAQCLKSVGSADEIVVVDSGSRDGTIEIASRTGATVFRHPLVDFADQRNYAMSLLRSEWVLHLDADERVTPELWMEIRRVIGSAQYDGYLVPCLNVTFGRALRHGGWYPQYHLRLQRRAKAYWRGSVHETAGVDGPIGKLREPILHFGHPDVHTFLYKLDQYTTLEATRQKRPTALLSMMAVLVPFPYFLYKYVIQLGFLDGWRGLTVALLLSFYRCVTYLKAMEQSASRTESTSTTK